MRVVITGATGFLGSAIGEGLSARGDQVVPARRSGDGGVTWSVDNGFARGALDGVDAVVHLAGEGIASRRWSAAQKEKIRRSRVQGTRRVVEAIARATDGPKVLLSASAVGVYGDRGDEVLEETSEAGDGFLAEVVRAWEAEALAARRDGVRVAMMRTGLVLGGAGGAIPRLRLPFSLGFGGRLGSGFQYMAWIHVDDVVRAALRILDDDSLSGPFNLTAPNPVTNRVFTQAMGRAMRRPTPFPAPRAALKLALGEMADETLLASQRAVPRALLDAGFTFEHGDLDEALADALG